MKEKGLNSRRRKNGIQKNKQHQLTLRKKELKESALKEKAPQPTAEKKPVLSWASKRWLREIEEKENQVSSRLSGKKRLFQKGVDASKLPESREGQRLYLRSKMGIPTE